MLTAGVSVLSLISSQIFSQNSFQKTFGHFEDSSEKQMSELFNSVRIPAEYEPTKAVLLSDSLFRYNEENYMKEILNSSAKEVWFALGEKNSSAFNQKVQEIESLAGDKKEKLKFFNKTSSGGSYDNTVWARDWAPLFGKPSNPEPLKLEDSQNFSLALMDFNYYTSRKSDDASGKALERTIREGSEFKNESIVRGSVPLYLEGGNFMITSSGFCAVSDKILEVNGKKFLPEDILFNEIQVKELLKSLLGCKTTLITESLPYERTRHIDMWAKFMSNTDVIVAEIQEDALSAIGSKLNTADLRATKKIQEFLNRQAEVFAQNGFKVSRIPMPLVYLDTYRSYTNSLIVNKTVFVPKYEKFDDADKVSYYDADFIPKYEEKVLRVYEQLGFEVKFLKADKLIADGGAIHCTSMQIPE
jgi:agmatine/peptidylarginine deiminase